MLLLGASIPVQMTDENQADTVPLFVRTLVFGYFNLLLEKVHLEFPIFSPSEGSWYGYQSLRLV